jgi:hypothetical protein
MNSQPAATAHRTPAAVVPRTPEQLTAGLRDYERLLVEAKRANAAARAALGGHIAAGDAGAEAACRKEIASSAAKITECTEALGFARDAIREAQERERAAVGAKAYVVIKRLVDEAVRDVEASEEATVVYARAKKTAKESLNKVRAELIRCGVPLERDQLDERFDRISKLLLWVESDGREGQGGGLENAYQLRQSGRVDLKLQAQEWRAVIFSRARSALHLKPE